jgi:isoquinoline 1-oxidoreductase beta subunit
MSTQATKERRVRVTRRGFLIGAGVTSGLVAGGLIVGLPYGRLKLAEFLDGAGAPFGVDAPPFSWFEILPDNRVIFHTPKVEMGQGIHTALAQIAADELGASFDQLIVQQASTQRGPNDGGGTGGSASVSSLFTPLREAAATAREMMREVAAGKLQVAAGTLRVEDGKFIAEDGRELTFGETVADVTEWAELTTEPTLKPRSAWRYIGQRTQRVDFEAKLTGQPVYGLDIKLPNMAYGAVARPATIEGKLVSADLSAARQMPGVIEIIEDGEFVAVVAETHYEAELARNQLDVTWDDGKLWQQEELDAMTTVGNGNATVIQKEGNAEKLLSERVTIEAEYRTPMAAHAHLEPQSAIVDVRADGVTAFVSTQFPDTVRGEIADVLGIESELVDLTASYLGGGFGRKLNTLSAVEAARLSQKVGRPIHIGWNRREEFRNGYLRPPTHSKLRGRIENGKLIAIEHEQASGDVAFPFFPAIASAVLGADFGAWRGGRIQYGIENRRTVAYRIKLPIATGWWRGLGLLANTFAIESFIDEAAYAAGADPLQFRLDHLGESEVERGLRGVLLAAAEKAGWGTDLPAGRARGIACSVDIGTPCAHVAEVSIEGDQIRVHKVTAAIDPGLIINPDGVEAQTQGSIIFGLSSTLLEKITVKDGQVEAANFNRYPLLTMKETPDIDIVLLESGGDPKGIGEPPLGPIAAAVANAVFTLTGKRLRELPLQL